MIDLQQYFMGRDKAYANDLTPEIEHNAAETVRRANLLLTAASADTACAALIASSKNLVASGWRPPGVNAATANAAKLSKHMTGQALDIHDSPTLRVLARWALSPTGLAALEEIGLWCERPQWCPSWLHVQTVPPKSGARFYVPSSAPPLCAALPGES